jgi:hypothetical protein
VEGSQLILTCDGCVMAASAHCADCLVTALTEGSRALDPSTTRAVEALQEASLLPPLRRTLSL